MKYFHQTRFGKLPVVVEQIEFEATVYRVAACRIDHATWSERFRMAIFNRPIGPGTIAKVCEVRRCGHPSLNSRLVKFILPGSNLIQYAWADELNSFSLSNLIQNMVFAGGGENVAKKKLSQRAG